jgi:hypothetical protein
MTSTIPGTRAEMFWFASLVMQSREVGRSTASEVAE